MTDLFYILLLGSKAYLWILYSIENISHLIFPISVVLFSITAKEKLLRECALN